MSVSFTHTDSSHLSELVRLERLAFAAKLRMARAALDCSQSELAASVGMTQRSVHKLEQGDTEPRRATVHAIEQFWRDHGIEFEDLADGGFRVIVHSALLDVAAPESGRGRHGANAPAGSLPAYRA